MNMTVSLNVIVTIDLCTQVCKKQTFACARIGRGSFRLPSCQPSTPHQQYRSHHPPIYSAAAGSAAAEATTNAESHKLQDFLSVSSDRVKHGIMLTAPLIHLQLMMQNKSVFTEYSLTN